MNTSTEKFAKLLTEAVYRIRSLEAKTVRIVQDELGYAIGKKGGASIEHWRKGFVPAKHSDTELLAREIIQRSDLGANWLQQFLFNANYPHVADLYDELFPSSPTEPIMPAIGGSTSANGSIPNNLPPQPTPFIGRKQELAEITKYLIDPTCRLLTLTGPGGIGKTRLAIQAASQHITATNGKSCLFSHGVCFVSLASLSSADFIVATIADALNFSFFSGEDLEDQLLSYLHEKKLLLILDNMEHLVQEVDLLSKILLRAPGVKMIITSRERLNLRGEWVIEIQGMNYPSLRTSPHFTSETAVSDSPPMTIENYSAIQLFLQSARRVHSDFSPSRQEELFVVQICQLVEGIPLAIELAASWVRILPCEEIVKEIKQNHEFLATSWRDMPERHRSLQAVFDYSWDLLSPQERKTIRKLAVFRGGFHREAAANVADASLLMLSSLVDKSFLYRQSTKKNGATARYEMHDLLRQYAKEKLNAKTAEKEETLARHCTHFAHLLHQLEDSLKGSEQAAALEKIGEEIENIRAGWRWAITEKRVAEINDYLESLFYFYDIYGWAAEGEETFGLAIRVITQQPGSSQPETKILLGKLLARQGKFCYRLGLSTKAQDTLKRSQAIFEAFEIWEELAFVLNQLAYVAYRLGQHNEAMELCHRSLAICRASGNQWEMAESLKILGEVVNVQGDYEEAKKIHQEGLEISQALGDRWGTAGALNRIGYLEWRLSRYVEAKRYCERSLAISKEVGDRRGIAMCYKNLGNIASELGDHIQARRHYWKGLRISEEIGHKWGIAAFLNNLATEAWELGDYEKGKSLGEKSLAIWQEMGYQLGMASTLETLGTIAEALGAYEAAKSHFQEALRMTLSIKTVPLSLDILVGLSILLAKEGETARAVEILTFILHHPMTDQESKVKARRRLPMLVTQLSPEELKQAEAKGRTERFEQIVREMLGERV